MVKVLDGPSEDELVALAKEGYRIVAAAFNTVTLRPIVYLQKETPPLLISISADQIAKAILDSPFDPTNWKTLSGVAIE